MAKSKKSEVKRRPARLGSHSASGKKAKGDPRAASSDSDAQVTIDRRTAPDRRNSGDRRKVNVPVAVERRKLERRVKVNRRRQIDPTTCERDYSAEELEFMSALDQYKRSSGRMFPTCSEILEVVRNLGYEKRQPNADSGVSGFGITVADVFCPVATRPTNK